MAINPKTFDDKTGNDVVSFVTSKFFSFLIEYLGGGPPPISAPSHLSVFRHACRAHAVCGTPFERNETTLLPHGKSAAIPFGVVTFFLLFVECCVQRVRFVLERAISPVRGHGETKRTPAAVGTAPSPPGDDDGGGVWLGTKVSLLRRRFWRASSRNAAETRAPPWLRTSSYAHTAAAAAAR